MMTTKEDAERRKIEAELEEWNSPWARANRRLTAEQAYTDSLTAGAKSQLDLGKALAPDLDGYAGGTSKATGGPPYKSRLLATAMDSACARIATEIADTLGGRPVIVSSNSDLIHQAVDHATVSAEISALEASAQAAKADRIPFLPTDASQSGIHDIERPDAGPVEEMAEPITAVVGAAIGLASALPSLFKVNHTVESVNIDVDREMVKIAVVSALRKREIRAGVERFSVPSANGLITRYLGLQTALRDAASAATYLTPVDGEETADAAKAKQRAAAKKSNDALIEAIAVFLRAVTASSAESSSSPLSRALAHEAYAKTEQAAGCCLLYVGKPLADATSDVVEKVGKDKIDAFASVSVPYMLADPEGSTLAAGIEHGRSAVEITLGEIRSPVFVDPD